MNIVQTQHTKIQLCDAFLGQKTPPKNRKGQDVKAQMMINYESKSSGLWEAFLSSTDTSESETKKTKIWSVSHFFILLIINISDKQDYTVILDLLWLHLEIPG